MIVVRTEFQTKSGEAGKAVDYFKGLGSSGFDAQGAIKRTRILTDLSGPFDTVVVESEIESIDAYLASLQAFFSDPQLMEQMNSSGAMDYRTGRRDFYTVEATY